MDNNKKFRLQEIETVLKGPQSLWIYFVIHPLLKRISFIVLNYSSLRPIHLSFFNAFISTIAGYFLLQATTTGYVVGGILSQIGFLADAMDGVVAKLKGTGSVLGALLDPIFDLWRILVLTICLSIGIWDNNGEYLVFLWGIGLLWILLFESTTRSAIQNIIKFYNEQKYWKLNNSDLLLLNTIHKFKKFNLRIVLFGFNEREALIFFIAPIMGIAYYGLMWGVIISIPFLFLRIWVDIALTKQKFVEKIND